MKNLILPFCLLISTVTFLKAQTLKDFSLRVHADYYQNQELDISPVINQLIDPDYKDWEIPKPDDVPVNIIKGEKGIYQFSGRLGYPVPFIISYYDEETKSVYYSNLFFVSPGENSIKINDLAKSKVVECLQCSAVNSELDSLLWLVSDENLQDPFYFRDDDQKRFLIEELANYIKRHSDSHVAMWMLIIQSEYGNYRDRKVLNATEFFSSDLAETKVLKTLRSNLNYHIDLESNAPRVGQKFPFDAFEYGKELQDLVNKNDYSLLDFWANWCGPCIADFKVLNEKGRDFPDLTFSKIFVSIDSQEDQNKAKVILKSQEFESQLLFDVNGEEGFQKYFYYVPTKFLLDKDGRVLLSNFGIEELYSYLRNKKN